MASNDTNDLSRIGTLGYCKPLAFETVTVGSTAVSLTSATYSNARFAHISCEGVEVRYRLDGGTPIATVGHLLQVNNNLDLHLHSEIVNLKVISVSGTSATITVTYYV